MIYNIIPIQIEELYPINEDYGLSNALFDKRPEKYSMKHRHVL